MCFPLADDGNGRLSKSCLPIIFDKLSSASACVIGCGLGRSDELGETLRVLLRDSDVPLVIDADGLFALGDDPKVITAAKIPPVLTPHEGEFARLGGALTGDRISDACGFAESRSCVLVLKGHRTICAFPDGETVIIPYGNPGMAKGGSGDVLAGIIGGLLCQLPLKKAVTTACAIHALAGDKCAERLGEYSMLPTDIIAAMPEIMREITEDN
jgi:NAD(P)H-hydrate epimerase